MLSVELSVVLWVQMWTHYQIFLRTTELRTRRKITGFLFNRKLNYRKVFFCGIWSDMISTWLVIKSIDKSIHRVAPTGLVSLHCCRQWRINDFMNPADRLWCSVSTEGYSEGLPGYLSYIRSQVWIWQVLSGLDWSIWSGMESQQILSSK